jgi:hypothetical protein
VGTPEIFMFLLSRQYQLIVGALLVVLMIVTRGHHFASVNVLPSASWAVFLLAGFYLSSRWTFPLFLALAAALDFSAVFISGVSSYCLSPAYSMLLPAYGCLWLGGRWLARHYQPRWSMLMSLAVVTALSAAMATVFSSGGFYWFSGRYTDPTLMELASRVFDYYPRYLANTAFYVAIALVCHLAFRFSQLHQADKASDR